MVIYYVIILLYGGPSAVVGHKRLGLWGRDIEKHKYTYNKQIYDIIYNAITDIICNRYIYIYIEREREICIIYIYTYVLSISR